MDEGTRVQVILAIVLGILTIFKIILEILKLLLELLGKQKTHSNRRSGKHKRKK